MHDIKTLISISYGKNAVETDKTKRAELYHKIQETAREDVPYLPIAYPKAVIAVDKSLMD